MTPPNGLTCDPYDPAADAETFQLDQYLAQFDERLLTLPEGRRILTEHDPFLFAWVYLRNHLCSEETGNQVTIGDMHLRWAREARRWLVPVTEPASHRSAEVAPRNTGKTTWWFLIIPMWLAAHGHSKFIGAFADSGVQAEMHLQTFKQELDRNQLLRKDFPLLCRPMERSDIKRRLSDNKKMTIQANGFVFAAKGVDAGNLGMKVGKRRPDTIIMDDVEPGEEIYSSYQAGQRLIALTDSIMPLNIYARVVLCGTTTMVGSIVHQLVKSVLEPNEDKPEWISAEKFEVHYHEPIVTRPDGTERSCWPARWSMDFLDEIRGTRQFLKNYMNLPAGVGDYWSIEDLEEAKHRGAVMQGITKAVLSIDPATTSKLTSDRTAFAVVAVAPMHKSAIVESTRAVVLPPARCRDIALGYLEDHPEIRRIIVEGNNGGDTWYSVYHNMPVPVEVITNSEPKPVRAARLLNHFQRRHAALRGRQPSFEEEALSFPRGAHDDVLDAVGNGVDYVLRTRRRADRSVSQSYVA
jgi:hypothetical protein